MAIFYYQGTDENGNSVSSVIQGASKSEAIYQLMERGINIIKINKAPSSRRSFEFKLNQKDMIAFFIHISEMAHAGMTTTQSLDLMVDLSDSGKISKVAKTLRSRVYDGMNLSDAMLSVGAFGEMFPNLIFVAEKTNSLNKVCLMIVDYIKWTNEMRRNITAAIVKPIFSLSFILILMIGMSIFVLPRLIASLSSFSGGKLPSQTLSFIAFTDFIRVNWYIFPLFIGFMFALNILPKRLGMRKLAGMIDRAKLKMPIFGRFLLKIEIARLSSFLAILINSGYKANEAILLSPRVVVNIYIRHIIEDVGNIMLSGDTIHGAFSQFKIFPKFFIAMLGIGEAVNDIQGTILNIKEAYDKEVRSSVELVISGVKPLVTILTGFIVGWMGMAVFGPMYSSIVNLSGAMK